MDKIVTFEKIVFDRIMVNDGCTANLLFTDTTELNKYCGILKNDFHASYEYHEPKIDKAVLLITGKPFFAVLNNDHLVVNYIQIEKTNRFLLVNDIYTDPRNIKFI